ncbi:hypothetical protein NQ317_009720 [Molorchus minor]|uniref:MADF domain-containing protein n=1 Tax=Molorchus minor TaxID=1323400 RepID=A0ABQ9JG82_9CUCU|nr:hypothetical protein NQ317_009720 [Molorchus minor]
MINKAYKELANKLKELDRNASRSFRGELKEIKLSQRSRAGTDEVYKPHLWYFDMMLFLMCQEMPRDSLSKGSFQEAALIIFPSTPKKHERWNEKMAETGQGEGKQEHTNRRSSRRTLLLIQYKRQ